MTRTSTCTLAAIAISMSIAAPALATVKVVPLTQDTVLDLPLFPGHATTLEFPEPVTQQVIGNARDYKLERLDDSHFTIENKQSSPRSNLNMETWSGHVVMKLRKAATADDAILHVRFVYPPEDDPGKADPGAVAEGGVLTPAARHKIVANHALQVTSVGKRKVRDWELGGHALRLATGHISEGATEEIFPFTLVNTGDFAYPVTSVELLDRGGRPVTASFHTKGGGLGESSELRPGQELAAVFVAEGKAGLSKGWSVRVSSTVGIPAAVFSYKVGDFDFSPGLLEWRTVVAVHALAGAGVLDDNVGAQQSAWGAVAGVGVNVLRGTSKHVAYGGGLELVRTQGAPINTALGERSVTATTGRLRGLAQLSTGEKIVPFVRVALGLAIARDRFDLDGTTQFRGAFVFGLGGGVDFWLGKDWVVGLGLAGAGDHGGGFALEGGISVGRAFGKVRNLWELD